MHEFKDKALTKAESDKIAKYREAYASDGVSFIPLAADSYGRIGPDTLPFLSRVADVSFTRSLASVELPCNAYSAISCYLRPFPACIP